MTDLNRYEPRRTDRTVEDEAWFREFLHRTPSGVLASVSDGEPFLTPLIFVYDPDAHAIYVHLSPRGRTVANVAEHDRVSFNVNAIGRFIPDWKAWEFSNEYESVTAFGTATVLEDTARKRHALQLLMAKYAPHLDPGEDYRPITDDEIDRTAVIAVEIDRWSGKHNAADPDAEGLYDYEDVRTDAPPEIRPESDENL